MTTIKGIIQPQTCLSCKAKIQQLVNLMKDGHKNIYMEIGFDNGKIHFSEVEPDRSVRCPDCLELLNKPMRNCNECGTALKEEYWMSMLKILQESLDKLGKYNENMYQRSKIVNHINRVREKFLKEAGLIE